MTADYDWVVLGASLAGRTAALGALSAGRGWRWYAALLPTKVAQEWVGI